MHSITWGNVKHRPTGINSNPSQIDGLLKTVIVGAHCWQIISLERAQHLINSFKLWSA